MELPLVQDKLAPPSISIGSDAWFTWLAQNKSFRYHPSSEGYNYPRSDRYQLFHTLSSMRIIYLTSRPFNIDRLMESNFFEDTLTQISANEDTIVKFFAVFSRFEYSLKRAGYFTPDPSNPSADWDRFANELDEYFEETRTFKIESAVNYLRTHPPKKETISDNNLSWKDVPYVEKQVKLLWLLLAIKRVRNNLFHGSKYFVREISGSTRNRHLLESSLCILEECLCLDAEPAKQVKSYFIEKL